MSNTMSEGSMWEIAMMAKASFIFKYGGGHSELVKIIAVGSVGESEYYFHGEGENSGTPYTIWYEDIDLKSDKFYKLVEVVA